MDDVDGRDKSPAMTVRARFIHQDPPKAGAELAMTM